MRAAAPSAIARQAASPPDRQGRQCRWQRRPPIDRRAEIEIVAGGSRLAIASLCMAAEPADRVVFRLPENFSICAGQAVLDRGETTSMCKATSVRPGGH